MRPTFMTPEELYILRKDLGVTQMELGEILNVSSKTIHRWETGNSGVCTLPESIIREKADAWRARILAEEQSTPKLNLAFLQRASRLGLTLEQVIELLDPTKEANYDRFCEVRGGGNHAG